MKTQTLEYHKKIYLKLLLATVWSDNGVYDVWCQNFRQAGCFYMHLCRERFTCRGTIPKCDETADSQVGCHMNCFCWCIANLWAFVCVFGVRSWRIWCYLKSLWSDYSFNVCKSPTSWEYTEQVWGRIFSASLSLPPSHSPSCSPPLKAIVKKNHMIVFIDDHHWKKTSCKRMGLATKMLQTHSSSATKHSSTAQAAYVLQP